MDGGPQLLTELALNVESRNKPIYGYTMRIETDRCGRRLLGIEIAAPMPTSPSSILESTS
jgi:hypothetical protein